MERKMKELDLSGVDPLRRAEVLRRIGVLDRYLGLSDPIATDAASHADEIGIGVQQFYRLARIWRIHRDPGLVGAGKRGGRRTRRGGVASEAATIVADVIRETGAQASQSIILERVAERCEAAGVKAPSRGAVWTYVMDARSTGPFRGDGPARIAVGRIWAKLPVAVGDRAIFPEVSLALLLPDRLVLGFDISCNMHHRASPSLALARGFAAAKGGLDAVAVLADAGDVDDLSAVHLARLGTLPTPSQRSVSRIMSEQLGRSIGRLGIMHRVHRAKAERLLKAGSARPVDCDAARAEIERAVSAHNDALKAGAAKTPPSRGCPRS
jgi:hypothetical protein